MGRPEGCKLIRLSAEITDGIITSISIRGDFFASPEEGFERAERRLRGTASGDIGPVFDALLAEEGVEVQGISGNGVAELLRNGMNRENCP